MMKGVRRYLPQRYPHKNKLTVSAKLFRPVAAARHKSKGRYFCKGVVIVKRPAFFLREGWVPRSPLAPPQKKKIRKNSNPSDNIRYPPLMAAAAAARSPAALGLNFPVCLTLFDEPVTLQCGHSLCDACKDGRSRRRGCWSLPSWSGRLTPPSHMALRTTTLTKPM